MPPLVLGAWRLQVSNKGGVGAVKTSDLSESLPTAGGLLCSLMVGSLKMGRKLQIYQRWADVILYSSTPLELEEYPCAVALALSKTKVFLPATAVGGKL